jgi:hypothetical protein
MTARAPVEAADNVKQRSGNDKGYYDILDDHYAVALTLIVRGA